MCGLAAAPVRTKLLPLLPSWLQAQVRHSWPLTVTRSQVLRTDAAAAAPLWHFQHSKHSPHASFSNNTSTTHWLILFNGSWPPRRGRVDRLALGPCLEQGLALTASARGAWAPLAAQPAGFWLPARPWCSSWRTWHSRCVAGSLWGQEGRCSPLTAPFRAARGTAIYGDVLCVLINM